MTDSLSAMSQEAHMHFGGHRAIPAQRAQRVQRKPRWPMAQNVPPPEEENPRLKCRDCGAFGHTSRSRRCPIKCSHDLLVPQPLKTRKGKENQDLHRLFGLPTPGTISQNVRHKKRKQVTGQRADEQKMKAPFKKFRMDSPSMDQDFNLAKPLTAHISGQPLRMQFAKISGDCWISRFIAVAPGLGIERETPPSECPAPQEIGKGINTQVPCNVLHEDLQVSSSSEDSGRD